MWLGGTERNIANAFEEAKDEDAVLVFDEVDCFLRDRRGAQRSWEVTQVNEMLTQMESFSGVFIATTNLINNLDQANLRRFDLKLEFKYLKAEQAIRLFELECKEMGLKMDGSHKNILTSFQNLTPGDFATIRRQNRFNPVKTSKEFIDRLRAETTNKNEDKSARMGFLG